MYELTVEEKFSAAHYLPLYPGQCRRLHGHTFRVRAVFRGTVLDPVQGYLVDFSRAKAALREVLGALDHYCLNELGAFADLPPTSENIARHIFQCLSGTLSGLAAVSVYESDTAWVTYSEDEATRPVPAVDSAAGANRTDDDDR